MKRVILGISNFSRDRRVLSAIVLIFLVGGFLWYMTHRSFEEFLASYQSYALEADTADNAAAVPAAAINPVRQQLNQMLVKVLSDNATKEERLASARDGLQYLEESNREIDAIGDRGGELDDSIARMERSVSRLGDLASNGRMSKIVALAKQRADMVSDIRGLSYRANFETKTIFDRIIADEGALTAQYAEALNNQIPDVEEQFNERTNLYTNLASAADEIRESAAFFK